MKNLLKFNQANETRVARIEIGDNPEFMKNYFPMKRVPYILVFFDRKPYYYNDIPDYSKIMRFIQRFKEPVKFTEEKNMKFLY